MSEEIEKEEIKKPNKFLELIKTHKIVAVLLVIIVVLLAYFLIKIQLMENDFDEKSAFLEKEYTVKIDSLRLRSMEQTINVFSWAVRSELNRENLEEVNNFFLTFVKEYGIITISLVNPDNNKIILSTDKKNEGELFTEFNISDINEMKLIEINNSKTVATPIMGLNKKTGVLVVRIKI
jgi:hypothetical protein